MKTTLTIAFTLLFFHFSFAQNTAIPDANFELALINRGLDSHPIDGFVPTQNIDTVKELSIVFEGINSLYGISDFTALTYLNCRNNFLTGLDLSNNVNLKKLDCFNNYIPILNLTNNQLLTYLNCDGNPLVSVDISNNLMIDTLLFGGPNGNPIAINQLNLSNHINLRQLSVFSTSISRLDLTSNVNLEDVQVTDNRNLICLNLRNGNNQILSHLNIANNGWFNCVQVDDSIYSVQNWTNSPNFYFLPAVSFSENCPDCFPLSVDESLESAEVEMFPNPSEGRVNVTMDQEVLPAALAIYTSLGQRITTRKITSTYSTIELPENQGVYFLELVDSKQRKKTFKILRR